LLPCDGSRGTKSPPMNRCGQLPPLHCHRHAQSRSDADTIITPLRDRRIGATRNFPCRLRRAIDSQHYLRRPRRLRRSRRLSRVVTVATSHFACASVGRQTHPEASPGAAPLIRHGRSHGLVAQPIVRCRTDQCRRRAGRERSAGEAFATRGVRGRAGTTRDGRRAYELRRTPLG
jgi:hypothetical protein